MKTYGIIPARLDSARLPGKMLLQETGKPVLQHTWEAASRAESLDEVIIATDSPQIADAASRFGARVEMTGQHPTGTDRIAEVVRRCCPDADAVVNVQGDEPELAPETIDRLVETLSANPQAEMATLATPIDELAVLLDRSCVKVVCAADGRALYFSRLPIPCIQGTEPSEVLGAGAADTPYALEPPWLLHLGIYAYRREFLLAFTEMPPSRLEKLENLEQLRALEAAPPSKSPSSITGRLASTPPRIMLASSSDIGPGRTATPENFSNCSPRNCRTYRGCVL